MNPLPPSRSSSGRAASSSVRFILLGAGGLMVFGLSVYLYLGSHPEHSQALVREWHRLAASLPQDTGRWAAMAGIGLMLAGTLYVFHALAMKCATCEWRFRWSWDVALLSLMLVGLPGASVLVAKSFLLPPALVKDALLPGRSSDLPLPLKVSAQPKGRGIRS